MKEIVLAALAVLITQDAPAPRVGPVTNAQIRAAREALDERLLDFPSARFRDVHGNGGLICGFFNAKNRMGAYSGWQRFAWLSVGDQPELILDDDILLDTFCGDDGQRLTGVDLSNRFES